MRLVKARRRSIPARDLFQQRGAMFVKSILILSTIIHRDSRLRRQFRYDKA
jgi:hypothetical protein